MEYVSLGIVAGRSPSAGYYFVAILFISYRYEMWIKNKNITIQI